MTTIESNGIVDVLSSYPVDRTVENLQRILTSKGIPVFAVIDHSGEAAKIGVKMLPTKLLIFGSPKNLLKNSYRSRNAARIGVPGLSSASFRSIYGRSGAISFLVEGTIWRFSTSS